MAVAAFFDMDRTLLRRSSNLLWIRYVIRRRELSLGELRRLGGILARYARGKLDVPALTREMAADIAGQAESERVAFTRRWFDDQLVHYVAAHGRAALAEHRARGHRIALITGSPIYTARALADHLGIGPADVLATRLEVRGGRFTGQVVEPICYGPGKLAQARVYAQRHGLDLRQSYFYTDSIADRPLLEQVGFPVAVNPERELAALAETRGWRSVRFY